MLLRLYSKGVYTMYGAYNYAIGKWRINEKGGYVHLRQQEGTGTIKDEYLKVVFLPRRTMQAGLFYKMPFYDNRQQAILQFVGRSNHSTDDPYQPALQHWRLKPMQPETGAAIKKRVVAYLHFLKSMYRHAIDNELETISTDWYPTPLKMYFGNGVRMAYSTELDDWNGCFYDSAQAVKGYQFISGPLGDITLKSGNNKFERNLDCVLQLLAQLEK
jgi:hypothetical protein